MFCTSCGNNLEAEDKFCTNCGNKNNFLHPPQKQLEPRQTSKFLIGVLLGTLFFIFLAGLIYVFILTEKNSEDQKVVADNDQFKNVNEPATLEGADNLVGETIEFQKEQLVYQDNDFDVASSIVNIYCEGEEGEISGGSGTIFTEDGLILTNAHIFPDSSWDDIYANDTLCVVTLPDPETGEPQEMYYGYPVFVEGLSDIYDLAFMQIYDVYYDEDNIAYGQYPNIFPVFQGPDYCEDEYIKLGEPVRVYGYPSMSGGYNLTITDGVVSSMLLDEGLIMTSAKISYGNSGGLAVDQNGCMIGVPTMVTGDEYESMGIIISSDLINEFMEQI